MVENLLRIILMAMLVFLLPHADWIPRKFVLEPDQIPLGMLNVILIFGFALWFFGKVTGETSKNPIRVYTVYLVVVVGGIIIALFTGFETDSMEILKAGKQEISLLLLYFIPLAITRKKEDFIAIFIIFLVVHALIGLEALRSGVLGGSAFTDSKRGSGPFGIMETGSDIAGAYLAQVIMFFLAIILIRGTTIIHKGAAVIGAMIIFLGILATFSRGALLGVIAGLLSILFVQGIKGRNLALAVLIVVASLLLIPQSTMTRVSGTVTSEGELDSSTKGRFDYYNTALLIVKDYPFGVGTGQIENAMKRYLPTVRTETEWGYAVDPHNGFLYILCENGVIGLVVFLWLLWKFFLAAREAYLQESLPLEYRTYALGMVGLLGSFVVCNMIYANFLKVLVMGTIVLHFGMLAFVKAKMTPLPSKYIIDEPSLEPKI